MLFAFRTIKPHTWGKPREGCDALWCEARSNGWILETRGVAPFAGGGVTNELARFAGEVLRTSKIDASGLDTAPPRLRYTSITGHALDITFYPPGTAYRDQHKIDGAIVDYRTYPLMGNPWVRQAAGGTALILENGGLTRTYDFAKWTVY
jgi:hypothetical protein